MKIKMLNIITNIIGFIFMLFGLYLVYAKYSITYIGFDIFIGLGLVFYKSKLYNKISEKI